MQTRKMLVCAMAVAAAFGSVIANGQAAPATKGKYDKYFITELPKPDKVDQAGAAAEAATLRDRPVDMIRNVLALNGKILEGGQYLDVAWIMKANPGKVWVNEHSHPFAEILGFFGSDPEHPNDLNAVIEISIGGEKHVLTKSALVFVPKGIKHCPLVIQKVDRPVLFITTGPTTSYDINR